MGVDIGHGGLPPIHGPQPTLRSDYQRRLDEVDDELVGAGLVVVVALPRIVRDLLAADPACLDRARAMAEDVSARCRYVEEQGFLLLLAREAPPAGDLLRLVAILRLVHSVERAAALLRHVAEAVDRFDARRLPHGLRQQIEELGLRSAAVFRRGVDAWRRGDGLAVHELGGLDAAIDRLRSGLVRRAAEELHTGADLPVIGLLARYLERIGGHGVTFAWHSTFVVTGERVELGP